MDSQGHAEKHRNLSGGRARAAVFGVSDGLVTNISLILGFSGAGPEHAIIRLAGLAGMVAGGFSMGAGEFLSNRVQNELFEREVNVERKAILADPSGEEAELAEIFLSRGVDAELARRLAADMMSDHELAVRTHAREELGIDTSSENSALKPALWSLPSFMFGALLPLLPYLFTSAGSVAIWSIIIAAISSLFIGGAIGMATEKGVLRSAVRQLLITAFAAGFTFFIGKIVGVH